MTERDKFTVGARVLVNEGFPDIRDRGRVGTVKNLGWKETGGGKPDWLRVVFDDNEKHPVEWHKDYFDIVRAVGKTHDKEG